MRTTKFGSLALGLLLLCGCGLASNESLNVVLSNATTNRLENVGVLFGTNKCTVGVVGAGTDAITGDYRSKITDTAEMHWDLNGEHHKETVNLSEIFKPNTSGWLTFTVTDSGVVAKFEASKK